MYRKSQSIPNRLNFKISYFRIHPSQISFIKKKPIDFIKSYLS